MFAICEILHSEHEMCSNIDLFINFGFKKVFMARDSEIAKSKVIFSKKKLLPERVCVLNTLNYDEFHNSCHNELRYYDYHCTLFKDYKYLN